MPRPSGDCVESLIRRVPFPCAGTGWNYFNADRGSNDLQVDRQPLEGVVGWDATVNGNLAELLQEPSLMGAYEGAGITYASQCFVFGNGPDSAPFR